jgi:hypothetical protein
VVLGGGFRLHVPGNGAPVLVSAGSGDQVAHG